MTLGTKDDAATRPTTPALPSVRPPTAPAGFHVLAKPTGPICNLDCEYCFFLSKEALYPGDRFRMGDELLDTYIRQLLESHTTPEVTIAWQGGEPTLMGVDHFRRAIELVEQYRRPGQTVEHTIQTNGTLLTDEWCELLAEHHFLVGISIDGPPELHDRYRVDKKGRPTYDRVVRGLDLLKQHGVDWNVLCTVNAANQHAPLDVYRFFRDDLGARHIQFIPIVE
ncbi:MAG TPA: radical SAM protein, partial [Acidimicrobiales bacterium]